MVTAERRESVEQIPGVVPDLEDAIRQDVTSRLGGVGGRLAIGHGQMISTLAQLPSTLCGPIHVPRRAASLVARPHADVVEVGSERVFEIGRMIDPRAARHDDADGIGEPTVG